jgi:Predicted ATPase
MNQAKLFVITGGPGVGKTTLINELNNAGYTVVAEDARKIIQEEMRAKSDGLPWLNKAKYAKLMLETSIKTYIRVCSNRSTDVVFFDRGILDSICYMSMENIPITPETRSKITAYPYADTVFILPPWKEIYVTDNERKQTWKEAVYTFNKMKETYLNYGYKVIEVPKCGVDKRRKFIESFI